MNFILHKHRVPEWLSRFWAPWKLMFALQISETNMVAEPPPPEDEDVFILQRTERELSRETVNSLLFWEK